jgi:hypothetical protein
MQATHSWSCLTIQRRWASFISQILYTETFIRREDFERRPPLSTHWYLHETWWLFAEWRGSICTNLRTVGFHQFVNYYLHCMMQVVNDQKLRPLSPFLNKWRNMVVSRTNWKGATATQNYSYSSKVSPKFITVLSCHCNILTSFKWIREPQQMMVSWGKMLQSFGSHDCDVLPW